MINPNIEGNYPMPDSAPLVKTVNIHPREKGSNVGKEDSKIDDNAPSKSPYSYDITPQEDQDEVEDEQEKQKLFKNYRPVRYEAFMGGQGKGAETYTYGYFSDREFFEVYNSNKS